MTNLCTLLFDSAITICGQPTLEDQVASLAEQYAEGLLESYRKGLHSFSSDASSAWAGLWDYLMEPLLDNRRMVPRVAPSGTLAEEVAAGLIRSGVNKEDIRANHQHITIALPNGRYRLYRGLQPGTPAGSLRILLPGMSRAFETGLASAELSRLILFIDSVIPPLKRVMDRLGEDIRRADKEYTAEQKAQEIAWETVSKLLEEVLPALDIEYSFGLVDGSVRLNLRKELQGSVDIPLDKMMSFLSDPERILSTLSPVKVNPTESHPNPFSPRNRREWPALIPKTH